MVRALENSRIRANAFGGIAAMVLVEDRDCLATSKAGPIIKFFPEKFGLFIGATLWLAAVWHGRSFSL